MIKHCEYCGAEMVTNYPAKKFCSETCAKKFRFTRTVGDYDYIRETDEPYFEFDCANCGRHVKIYSRYDQRIKFCCGVCAKAFHDKKQVPTNKSGNNLSAGMSLGSLIRREKRALYD